jgi:hypothetical protein
VPINDRAEGCYSQLHGVYISAFTTQVFPGVLQVFVENLVLDDHAFCVEHLYSIGAA